MSSSRASDAKRRIGGHFGAAVAASTKRQRTSWRDELDEDEQAATAAAAANGNGATVNGGGAGRPGGASKLGLGLPDDSESEEMVDPGTPLPSDEEGEDAPAGDAPNKAAALEVEDAAPVQLPPEHAPVEQAAGAGAGAGAASSSAEAAVAAPAQGEVPVSQAARPPVEITFELVVGAAPSGQLRICFPDGLDDATERRLAACEPPEGAGVEAVVSGGFCTFGGHGGLPTVLQGSSSGVGTGASHSSAGLLSAPREHPTGLLLTFGAQPQLDASHKVLGKAVQGRSVLRRLQALAPCFRGAELELKPRIEPLLLRRVIPSADKGAEEPQEQAEAASEPAEAGAESAKPSAEAAGEAAGDSSSHIANGCGGAKGSSLQAGPTEADANIAFSQDQELDARAMGAESLEVAELEINGREAEVTELKQMAFSRERVQGVAAVEDELGRLEASFTAMESLDEALTHQRSWLQERIRHLLRLLKKLR